MHVLVLSEAGRCVPCRSLYPTGLRVLQWITGVLEVGLWVRPDQLTRGTLLLFSALLLQKGAGQEEHDNTSIHC